MAGKGKNLLAPLSDAEALAAMKRGVFLFSSPQSPFTGLPEQFEQPSVVQSTYDGFKAIFEAAHPNESKQNANERAAQRKLFNETMGNFVDTVALASRKAPTLLSMFSFDVLVQDKPKTANKAAKNLVPILVLQAIDKEQAVIQCKVRNGVKKAIEIQHTYDDPTIESNWLHNDSYVNSNFAMPGLTSGRRTYVRGRYIFAKGKKGPWSEMVSIMVP